VVRDSNSNVEFTPFNGPSVVNILTEDNRIVIKVVVTAKPTFVVGVVVTNNSLVVRPVVSFKDDTDDNMTTLKNIAMYFDISISLSS